MHLVGFMILRNGVRMDYPFREAIASALPLCDQFYVSVGQSDDGTWEALTTWNEPKLILLRSEWDLSLREGGKVLAQETNKLLAQLPPADWYLYLQADEVLHEEDYPALHEQLHRWLNDSAVEGLVFDYVHFYGSYRWVGASRKWYRREVRVIRRLPGIESYRDAQGFRRWGRKLRVKPAGARIFHYGWVRPPERQRQKLQELHRYWHSDTWIKANLPETFVYDGGEWLVPFNGTHPALMQARVAAEDWIFRYDPQQARLSLRDRVLHWIEAKTGWRPGEFRNYRLI